MLYNSAIYLPSPLSAVKMLARILASGVASVVLDPSSAYVMQCQHQEMKCDAIQETYGTKLILIWIEKAFWKHIIHSTSQTIEKVDFKIN